MDEQSMQEMLRLTRENNHMLHAMRRNAFWGGILKFIFWTAIFVAPIWFYMTYLNVTVEKMLHTLDQIQGSGAQAQVNYEQMLRDIQSKLPTFMQSSSSTHQ
jgi:hypothetical protein